MSRDLYIKDKIRGCLMAGAAGDALGYTVEFWSRQSILAHYGANGITRFDLRGGDKALVSDDTQMTLFTANGVLTGLTRHYMRGVGSPLEYYARFAYIDWYCTQTGNKRDNDFAYTWLRDLPEMAHRRAPGNTCLTACKSLFENKEVQNNSMGCGGIMRVAPFPLIAAGYEAKGMGMYTIEGIARGGAEIAECTHKHPQGYIPSAALAVLLYKIAPLTVAEVCEQIDQLVAETVEVIDRIYTEGGECQAKNQLKEVTERVMRLAHSDIPDIEAIKQLGEGWVALEAWAIALYCAVRHIDSVEDAIIAAVNHDGDSDSTGSICGNIMGAIYGYEHIKSRNIFCPEGKELEQTLELSEIILAMADDLSSECPIGECMQIERPEQIQWLLRYCEMEPAGIGKTENNN